MGKISAATLVGSVGATDEFPLYDGTATAKKCTALQLGQYQDGRRRQGARVGLTSTFEIADGAWVEVDWGANDNFDEGGFWDIVSPAKMIVPAGEAGEYYLGVSTQWEAAAVSGKFAAVRVKIGGTVLDSRTVPWLNTATYNTDLHMVSIITLAAAAEVTVEAWQDTGAARDLGTSRTNFDIFQLGKAP